MQDIRILDCTLRDGGRIIDCKFPDINIRSMIKRLKKAGIDIIEVGFLRDAKSVNYKGNSTFFTSVGQIVPFLPEKEVGDKTEYVAFIDYGMFDFETLSKFDNSSITGIRFGFTRKNFCQNYDDVYKCAMRIKEMGYTLYVQGVNTPGYTDEELLEVIKMINRIQPHSFGVVDTYGSMDLDDLRRVFSLVNHNIDSRICIDFHSHNNFQLSFALSQEMIRMSNGNRNIIIDATLLGMGKSAGNLNTELIAHYLYQKMNRNYRVEDLFDMIDDYIVPLREENEWGYSLPAMISGIYQSHPNNVLFLTSQYRISATDIKHIISKIEPATRERYDYDNIRRIYTEYNSTKIDDSDAKSKLRSLLSNGHVLLVMPGRSLDTYREKISAYISENRPVIISTSFVYRNDGCVNYAFYASPKRYEYDASVDAGADRIITSNIRSECSSDIVVNYETLIENRYATFENSSAMLIKLLLECGISEFAIAGFDGFKGVDDYCDDWTALGNFHSDKYSEVNDDIYSILSGYASRMADRSTVKFLTPSIFADIFGGVTE